MECPKCGFAQDQDPVECPRCGVVFAKFLRADESAVPPLLSALPPAVQADLEQLRADRDEIRHELRARVLAFPCALIGAWMAVKTAPGLVRIFSMWVHESGHAVAAWMCGYSAWPGPWFTPVANERSVALVGLLVVLLGFGAFRAWQLGRRFWVVAATVTLLLTLCCTLVLNAGAARQLITFGGDGGCFVLGAALMLTVYARPDHPLRRERLRWALLILGALAFMDAYRIWSGSFDRLPFGESENGLSDPSVLVEEFGWGVVLLVNRYLELARVCFLILTAAYIAGIAESVIALRGIRTDDDRDPQAQSSEARSVTRSEARESDRHDWHGELESTRPAQPR
jgi:hypothetical protein